MAKKIAWTDPAKADLRAIDQAAALRILHTLARYLSTGKGDIKRLQDVEPSEYRLRAGDYRIRFHDGGNSIELFCKPATKKGRHHRRPHHRLTNSYGVVPNTAAAGDVRNVSTLQPVRLSCTPIALIVPFQL